MLCLSPALLLQLETLEIISTEIPPNNLASFIVMLRSDYTIPARECPNPTDAGHPEQIMIRQPIFYSGGTTNAALGHLTTSGQKE